MNAHRTRRVLTGAMLTLLAAACSSDGKSAPDVAAVVQGADLAAADVEAMTSRYQSIGTVDAEHALIPMDEARQIVLNFLIRTTLLKQLAAQAGVEPVQTDAIDTAISVLSPEELAAANLQPADLRASIEAGELSKRLALKQFPSIAVSDFEIQEVYDQAADRYIAGWSALVRVAYFTTSDQASAFVARAPAADVFDSVATELGATKAGSMGTVSNVDALGENVIRTLGELPPNQLSEPLEATGGWLVFLVESRTDVAATSLEQARPELLTQLQDKKRQKLFVDWFDQQLKTAVIKVDKYYGTWNVERLTVEK